MDDGSTDDSLEIARGFEARGVRLMTQPNRGASAARNALVEASRGAWLQYLDADDLLAPDKIEKQMALAASIGDDKAICARWGRFRATSSDAEFAPLALSKDAGPVDWLVLKLSGNHMMHPGAWLVSRALTEKAGPWDVRLSLDDDGEYFTRIVLASAGVRDCAGATSFYRSHVIGSLSGRRSAKAFESAYLSATLCAKWLLEVEDSARTHRACADMFMRLAHTIYPDEPKLVRACEEQSRVHGGSSIRFEGGQLFTHAASLLGWKTAKRLQGFRARALGPNRRPRDS